jgi:hypothetical protein
MFTPVALDGRVTDGVRVVRTFCSPNCCRTRALLPLRRANREEPSTESRGRNRTPGNVVLGRVRHPETVRRVQVHLERGHVDWMSALRPASTWTPRRSLGCPGQLRRGYRDQQGGFPRVRPFHCTEVGLTPALLLPRKMLPLLEHIFQYLVIC